MATKLVSLIALGATIVPCLFYFTGVVNHDVVKVAALVGTIAWFIATPMWMGQESPMDASEVEI